jgi:PhnB protein
MAKSKKKPAKKPAAKSTKPKKPAPIPAGYASVTPYLHIQGAAAALEFYKKAFDAEAHLCMAGDGGRIMHAEMKIGDSFVMLADEFPDMGVRGPASLGGTSVSIHLYVKDCDATFNRAVAAGATPLMPPADMFWGDRFGKLADPYGHHWSVATHVEDVGEAELEKRKAEWMKQMSEGKTP